MGLFENLEERFSREVELVPFSGCHYWMGRLNDAGYGVLSIDGREVRAHRLSYELAKGPIPAMADGKPAHILHSCDTPLCVNPDHLRPGTPADNAADKVARGRVPRGEGHCHRRLSDEKMRELCARMAGGASNVELMMEFGLGESRVSTIRHGKAYADFLQDAGGSPATGRSDRRVSDVCAREIYRRAHAGEGNTELAQRYGVKPSFIADIRRGATYASVTGHGRL